MLKNFLKAVTLVMLMTVYSCEKGTPNQSANTPATVDPDSGGEDSGSGGGDSGSGGGDTPSTKIKLPYEISRQDSDGDTYQYAFSYGENGIISSYSYSSKYAGETSTDVDNYAFTFTSLSLTISRTGTSSSKTWTRTLSNGYVKSYTDDMTKYDFEYNNGCLKQITATDTYGNKNTLTDIWSFTWSNECLTKVVHTFYDDQDPIVLSTYVINYGSELNPYFGKNFEPLCLHTDVADVYPYTPSHMLGLYGKNSKYLATSVKHTYIDEWDGVTPITSNCALQYQFKDGLLSGMTETYSDNEEVSYTIKNKAVN
ncbi:MAG: hypothetical protein IKR69_05825 [Bacteroidales bacterium]|nr:hypothetical protein [Bacteroidales bacterium]